MFAVIISLAVTFLPIYPVGRSSTVYGTFLIGTSVVRFFFHSSFFLPFLSSSSFFSLRPFNLLWASIFINLAEIHSLIMSSFDKFLNPAFCANNTSSPCPNKTSQANSACGRCYLVVVSLQHFDLFKALHHILIKIKTVLRQRMPERTLAHTQREL